MTSGGQITTTYIIRHARKDGMYTSGDRAATIPLALQARGDIHLKPGDPIHVWREDWVVTPSVCTATRGLLLPEIARRVLVAAGHVGEDGRIILDGSDE